MKSSRLGILALALLPVFGASGKDSTPPIPAKFQHAAEEAKKHFERGNFREAEKIYETIVAASPKNLYALSNLGVVRFRLGKLKPAEEAFRRAIALAPNDAFSHCTLGIIYFSQNRYDDAIKSLRRAVQLDPRNATAHNYLGSLYSQSGMHEEAVKEFQRAQELDPRYKYDSEDAQPIPEGIPAKFRINEA